MRESENKVKGEKVMERSRGIGEKLLSFFFVLKKIIPFPYLAPNEPNHPGDICNSSMYDLRHMSIHFLPAARDTNLVSL
jgi:hypothetical protein